MSRGISPSHVEKPGFSRGRAGWGRRRGEFLDLGGREAQARTVLMLNRCAVCRGLKSRAAG